MIGPAFNTVGIAEASVLFWVIGGALTCGLAWLAMVLVAMSGPGSWRTVGALLAILVGALLGSEVLRHVAGPVGGQALLGGLEESFHKRIEETDIEELPSSRLPWKTGAAKRVGEAVPFNVDETYDLMKKDTGWRGLRTSEVECNSR